METLSARAKEELARVVPNNGYDARAELSAIVSCAGSVNISHGGMTVSVAPDNRDMPALVSKLSLMLMMPIPRAEFAKHITLTFDGGREVLEKLLIFRGGDRPGKVEGIDALLVRGDSEKRAYVRGAFLGAGFLSAGRNNHMEFAFSGEKQRDDVLALFPEGLTPGAGRRGGRYTAYFKSKEKISDALVYMGATKAALVLQQEILLSSVGKRASAARNCDEANIDRALDAAEKQIRDIDRIDAVMGLESLDERLRTTALLRKAYPEMSMSELADMLGVSKSCVKHRLEKLAALAAGHA